MSVVTRSAQSLRTRLVRSVAVLLLTLATLMSVSVVTAPAADAATYTQRLGALSVAKAQYGDPYAWGAAGPNAFDCSGLTYYSYRMKGITIPRTSEGQRTGLPAVSKAYRQPGDLIIFTNSYGRAYHVGIYAGNNQIVHSSTYGTPVRLSSIWTTQYVVRRP